MLRKKKCTACGRTKLLTAFNLDAHKKDGHRSGCRECQLANYSGRKPRQRREYQPRVSLYRVIYDPLDSFGENSSFTRQEISDMLDDEYLAIGTRFRRGKFEYRVNDDLRLMRETAGVAG